MISSSVCEWTPRRPVLPRCPAPQESGSVQQQRTGLAGGIGMQPAADPAGALLRRHARHTGGGEQMDIAAFFDIALAPQPAQPKTTAPARPHRPPSAPALRRARQSRRIPRPSRATCRNLAPPDISRAVPRQSPTRKASPAPSVAVQIDRMARAIDIGLAKPPTRQPATAETARARSGPTTVTFAISPLPG